MPQMTIAKADKDDLQKTLYFFMACELGLERQKFSLQSSQDQWEDLDDDDEDKIRILKIRNGISQDEGCNPEDVDNRIVMYEYLSEKFYEAACCWRRVYYAADLLIDNFCDPTLDHLASLPGIELFHVANEQ